MIWEIVYALADKVRDKSLENLEKEIQKEKVELQKCKDDITRDEFKKLLNICKNLSKTSDCLLNKHPLKSFITALVNRINCDMTIFPFLSKEFMHTTYSMRLNKTGGASGFDIEQHLPFYELRDINKDIIIKTKSYQISLAHDSIISAPWNEDRLMSAFQRHSRADWFFDSHNHYVSLYLPFGVGQVRCGNHSIALGLINKEGTISSENVNVYDISRLYDLTYTDGVYYYRSCDNTILKQSNSFELSLIFEIGRLMMDNAFNMKIEKPQ